MKAPNGTYEKWTRRSPEKRSFKPCCLFVLLLFSYTFFQFFFGNVISRSGGTRGAGQREETLIIGIFKLRRALVYRCQYFVNDLPMRQRFCVATLPAALLLKTGRGIVNVAKFPTLLCLFIA